MLPAALTIALLWLIAIELLCLDGVRWRERKPRNQASRNLAERPGAGGVNQIHEEQHDR